MTIDRVVLLPDEITSFEEDGYVMTPEMSNKYASMILKYEENPRLRPNGWIRRRPDKIYHNASIIDLEGFKIGWGDIGRSDLEHFEGVNNILSEQKSFWSPDLTSILIIGNRSHDPNSVSPFRDWLPPNEVKRFKIDWTKRNAIGRITDGVLEYSKTMWRYNNQ